LKRRRSTSRSTIRLLIASTSRALSLSRSTCSVISPAASGARGDPGETAVKALLLRDGAGERGGLRRVERQLRDLVGELLKLWCTRA